MSASLVWRHSRSITALPTKPHVSISLVLLMRRLNIIVRMRIVLFGASSSRLLTMLCYKGGENKENNQHILLASLKTSHEEVTSNASRNCACFSFPHPPSFFFMARGWRETILKTKQWERFLCKGKQHQHTRRRNVT